MINTDKIKLYRELLSLKDIMIHRSEEYGDYYSFYRKTNDCDYDEICLVNYLNFWFDLISNNVIDNYNTRRVEYKCISDRISCELIEDSLGISIFKEYYDRELFGIGMCILIHHDNLEKFLTILEENILLSSIENKEVKTTKRGRL